MDLARKAGNGTVPTASPSDVATKNAAAQVSSEYPTPAADGLTVGSKTGSPWTDVGRLALAALCLSPLLVTIYFKTVSYKPMQGQDGTWASDVWQHDIPSSFRTKSRGGELLFYALGTGNVCGEPIGSAPALDDPSSDAGGTIGRTKVTLSPDRGLLAISFDQPDPWSFFTRGPTPRHRVTVRFHQTATQACEG